jgi:hypothetical protein
MVQAHSSYSSDEHATCRRPRYCRAGDREDKGQSNWTGEDVGTTSPNKAVSGLVPTLAWATSFPRHSARADNNFTPLPQSTWTAAVLLSRELVSRDQAMQIAPSGSGGEEHDAWSVRGKSCLELGCGTGLTGLTAIALQCQQCTFTGTNSGKSTPCIVAFIL